MKKNKIYWKCNSELEAIVLLKTLEKDCLIVKLVEMKNFKQKIIGYVIGNTTLVDQINFVNANPITSYDMFYVIQTVD